MTDFEAGAGPPAGPGAPPDAAGPPAAPGGPPPAGPPGASLASRLTGVVHSPAAAFRQVLARPSWAGALSVYLLMAALMVLVYSLRVDWEAFLRGQFEETLVWKVLLSVLPDEEIDRAEKAIIEEYLSPGTGGVALMAVVQTLTNGAAAFQVMGILFATLFYLMGSLEDLRLGRVYLDGLLCLGSLLVFFLLGGLVRAVFGEDAQAALPYVAGIYAVCLVTYLWLLRRSVARQPAFQRLMAVYAHGLVIPAAAAALSIIVMLMQSEALTVGADEILRSNLGALMGIKGSGVLATLLSSLDLFRLWQLVVLSIGFASLTGLSTGASAAITFLPWGFLTMVKLALAAVFGGE